MIKNFFLKLIKFYQIFISPSLGKHCRFYPSCSEYFYLVIKKYGILKGLFLGAIRILKCHPLHPGGIDLP
jgi:putative membrane protein insertion efficiency factor